VNRQLSSATEAESLLSAGGARVLLVSSGGGHLAQLLTLRPWWENCERSWVCFEQPDALDLLAAEHVAWAYSPTTRNARNFFKNLWLAIRVLRKERPEVVVSTGAGVAVPFFVIARLLRIPTVFVEVVDRVASRTLTGRLCRPFSSAFCVQWPEQALLYPGSVVVGPLL
jgi:UDP-N-acetylglucosamine:LPS N-acetylglucosamine transferase